MMTTTTNNRIFDKFDKIKEKVDAYRNQPLFSEEVYSRNNRYENTITSENNNLLRVMAKLIAYSNNAPSDKVNEMLEAGVFERVFHNFDLFIVANENPKHIINNEWHELKAIRFKKKIKTIITCANLIKEHYNQDFSIESLYKKYKLPINLRNESDITNFWKQFDIILKEFQRIDMPYYKNITTLLHLLLHLGFPCVKPDVIIMRVAAKIKIIPERANHNTYNIEERRKVVKTIQEYCLSRNIKLAVMDLYSLIYGGQKDALKYVNSKFSPLSKLD